MSKTAREVYNEICRNAQTTQIFSAARGYAGFRYISHDSNRIKLERRNQKSVTVSFSTLKKVISGVQTEEAYYHRGPSALRELGISHINSPTWALVRLLPLGSLKE